MKNIKKSLVAVLLVSALAVPVLANGGATISGNAEEAKQSVLDHLINEEGLSDKWGSVDLEKVEFNTTVQAGEVDWNAQVVDNKSEGQLAVDSGIDKVISTIDATALIVNTETTDSDSVTELAGGLKVSTVLSEDFYVEPMQSGYDRDYYVLRIHETKDGQTEVERLEAKYDEGTRTVTFTSDKFSSFVFGYTDRKIDSPVAPQTSTATENNDKPVAAYDDGGPFTTDACGNVFDRWGNEVYHAPVCVNENTPVTNGYQLVNTLDK